MRARAILDVAGRKIQRGREAGVPEDPERQAKRAEFLRLAADVEAVAQRRVLYGTTAQDVISSAMQVFGLLGPVVDARAREIAASSDAAWTEVDAFMESLRHPARPPARVVCQFGYHHCTTTHEDAHAWSSGCSSEPLDAGEWPDDCDLTGGE